MTPEEYQIEIIKAFAPYFASFMTLAGTALILLAKVAPPAKPRKRGVRKK